MTLGAQLAQLLDVKERKSAPGKKEVLPVSKRFPQLSLFVAAVLIAVTAIPAFAAPVPSKTAANQSLDSRAADIAMVRDVVSDQEVAKVLAARGFSQEQVNQKLAQLSPQDLHQLAGNLNQLQAAGLTHQEWIWVGIGAVAAVIIIIAVG
jgi:hypothetical protein